MNLLVLESTGWISIEFRPAEYAFNTDMSRNRWTEIVVPSIFTGVFVLMVLGYLYGLRLEKAYRAQYIMDPQAFCEQAYRIKPGDRADHIRDWLRGVTRTRQTSSSVSFAMDPMSTRTTLREPRTQWIHVSLDEKGRVAEVTVGEGRRVLPVRDY